MVKFKTICDTCGDEKLAKHHCDNKLCPTCAWTWARKRANKAADKIESAYRQMGGRHRPRPVVVSLPASVYDLPFNEAQQLAKGLLNRFSRGTSGGVYVGHPWRFRDSQGERLQPKHCDLVIGAVEPIYEGLAVYSPHVHAVMFGWIVPTDEIERETGVVFEVGEPLATRDDVFGYIFYSLTHCGVHETYRAPRWFGALSYTNFVKVSESTETVYPVCQICGGELWDYSLEGDLLQRHCLEITRYHYRFKPRQKTLVPQKRIKKADRNNLLICQIKSRKSVM